MLTLLTDISQYIELIKTIGLPLVILIGLVYYFYLQLNKKDVKIDEKETVILQLSKEKIDILQKALERYSESDKENVNALNQINITLNELKNQLVELKYKINN